MTDHNNTPMMKQYHSIKERYADAILFYRMGDFYEMFYEDARKAALILEITLTSRNKNEENPVPMCGVPVKAADNYIARLIESGQKVAVCEQVEDPAQVKGLVKREVVRVVTPGMIINESLLDSKSNNYLLSVCKKDGTAGIAYLDISTGAFFATEQNLEKGRIPAPLLDEVLRVNPSEILLPEHFKDDPGAKRLLQTLSGSEPNFVNRNFFSFSGAKERLCETFSTRSLKGFGCDGFTSGLCAAGAVITYVRETQMQDISHISGISPYRLDSYLVMDERSCRNLELLRNIQTLDKKGSLLDVMDKTVTAMGGRLLKTWLRYPLVEKDAVEQRLDAVSEAVENPVTAGRITDLLKDVYDIERITGKISMKQCNARDLTALKNSLFKLPELLGHLDCFSSPIFTELDAKQGNALPAELNETARLIHTAVREDAPHTLNEGNLILQGFNPELDELISISTTGKEWIAKAQAEEKEKTGLSSLKIKYNKVFGYFIEVSKTQAPQVPEHYLKKQTLVNSERFITEEMKEVESKILNAQERRAALEYEIFCGIRDKIGRTTRSLLKAASFLARVDVLLSFAGAARENSYTRPSINTGAAIRIREGRHPVVEKMIEGERYVPNSIEMDNTENQILLITGPNMAGKSTVLRQVALTSVMAQMGSFVPAGEASICILDRIFTRVGALDNLSQGQSTFMVEMEETANIVNNANENSLVILDEIGRGTSTYDGMSIAWAVAEHLHDINGKGVKTLFATHYHELIKLGDMLPRVKNFNIAVKEFNDNIVFLRTLVRGGTNKSYGIQVARLAGVPDTIIKRAKKVLQMNENNGYTGNFDKNESNESAKGKNAEKDSGSTQLELFQHRENEILQILDKTDISSITPIEALNLLNDMKSKMQS
ncbi:MAG: DNA mismatch repair protein MutS [Thermodesulfobacteriota bacterium]